MIYTTYAYGHDFGNSETCGALSSPVGTSHVLTLPSALSPGTYDDLIQKVNGSSATGNLLSILNDKAHTIEVRGKHWYVGELAIDQASPNIKIADLTARGDISRYWSDRNLAFLLTTSGTLIADREYGLAVVTNLPIATHNEANVQQVKATLSGDHTFVLDGRSRIAHIRVMKTIMEGAGAAIAYGPGGQTKVGIIDIGGRTTDTYLVKGQLPIQEQCGSLDVGVESASDAIVTAFERRFAYPLSPSDARALLFCYTRGKDYQAIATVMNAELDSSSIDQLIREQLRETGQKIVDFIKRTWTSSMSNDVVVSDVTLILLVGGGAYYFDQDVRPLFKKRLHIPQTPEYANALGYARLAKHYQQRELKAQ